MNNSKPFSIKISGPAGAGIAKLGEILSSAFNREGFFTLVYSEYPSRIRGGDNNIQIVISRNGDISPKEKVDLLFAFDDVLLEKHKNEVISGGKALSATRLKLNELGPVKENPIVLNSAVAGFLWSLFLKDLKSLNLQIKESVKEAFLKANLEAVHSGFELNQQKDDFDSTRATKKIVSLNGNELFAKAAEQADCQYASIYPMTPITGFLNSLSKTKIKTVMPEDEIFAALSTLGASYAGKRAITATSGGGFCLMSEAVGFAGMAEIPLVILLGQRTGPSSGIPTFTSQADLLFAINSSHGDFSKIVLAPGDLEEVYFLTQEAFNLADIYQVPVIILTDKYLSESRFSTTEESLKKIKVRINRGKRFKKQKSPYKRYQTTPSGVSARAFPGETAFITNSYEHDEYGFSTDEVSDRLAMVSKRERKLKNLQGGFSVFGDKDSKKLILGWGSTKTQILEYIRENPRVKFIHVNRPWPFPQGVISHLEKAKKIIIVENNFSGQMAQILKGQTTVKVESILKDDGRPFFQEELDREINKKI